MPAAILPISRFPTSREIQDAMTMAEGSIESAEYLLERVIELAKNSKEAKNEPAMTANLLSVVSQFVAAVKFKLTASNQPWAGEVPEASSDKNMFKNIAQAAAQQLMSKAQNISLDYAVGADGRYVRGYASPDGALDQESVASLDRLFNAWLVSQDYAIQGGYIYQANNEQPLSAAAVKKLMDEGGYEAFIKEKGVNLTKNERAYPGQEATEKLKKDAGAVAERAAAATDTTNNTPENPEPEQSSGMSTRG